jgi:hypothetical protein
MPPGKSAQSGFTYLFVLMLIALIGMGLVAAGTFWSTDVKRAREAACGAPIATRLPAKRLH